jgi:hypothetical protein
MALIGEVAAVVPMLVMTLHPTQTKSFCVRHGDTRKCLRCHGSIYSSIGGVCRHCSDGERELCSHAESILLYVHRSPVFDDP